MRILIVAIIAVAACYSPEDAPCTIRCSPTDVCPGDQTCGGDGFCHDPGDDQRCVGFTLDVTLGGTGTGVVRSSPAGIDCDGTAGCRATFPAGTQVTLSASPGVGARLSSWSGGCDGIGPCVVALAGDVAIGATFNRAARLAVTLDPTRRGAGTVVSEPPGITCPGSACGADFDVGQSVVLTATAAAGSRLGSWTQCPAAAGATCTITLASDADAAVQFIRTPRLTVDVVGTSDFAITSMPAGLTCGATSCSGTFDHGQDVVVTAADGVASRWKRWTGCAAAGPCTVAIDDADVAIGASYRDLFVVSATAQGTGTGTLSAPGLTCVGPGCSGTYEDGDTVTITASVAAGSRFAGWSGCDTTAGADCVVNVATARSVAATFVRQHAVTLDLSGSGAGSVTIAGGGTCTADCTQVVDQGALTLTQTAAAGSRHDGFAGGCTSAGPSCATSVAAATTVVVRFVRQRTVTLTVADGLSVTTPAGSCVGPASCGFAVDDGQSITMGATTAVPGQRIVWSNGCTATCAITVTADTALAVALEGGHGIWMRAVSRADTWAGEYARATAIAADGDVVWAGSATGGAPVALGGAPVAMTASVHAAWVARYAPDGTPRWARSLSTVTYSSAFAVCVTASGDVIVGGHATGVTSLDGASIDGVGRSDGWVLRMDGATGAAEWMVKLGGPANHAFYSDLVSAVACDGEEVVVLAELIGPDYRLSDGPLVTGAPEFSHVVARLDAAGHHLWSRQVAPVPAGSYNAVTGLAVGGGGVHVVGSYSNQFDPGTGLLPFTPGHPSDFAVRYHAITGAPEWATALGLNAEQGVGDTGAWPHVELATMASDGTLVIGGYLEGSDGQRVNLGTLASPVRVTLRGPEEMFLVRLSPATGAAVGAVRLGSAATTGVERLSGLCRAGDDLVVRGRFTTAGVDVGGVGLAASGGAADGFVARLSLAGVAAWAHRLGPFTAINSAALAVGPTGEVAIASAYTGDPAPYDALDLPASGNGDDSFLLVLGR